MKGGIGKLTKLKSALKNWPSRTRRSRNTAAVTVPVAVDNNVNDDEPAAAPSADEKLQAVYVGRCRRQYFVTSEVINHPLFQVLVDKSELGSGEEEEMIILVACEVVMFDHLLWMLENTTTDSLDPNSMDELVQFYTA